MTIKERIKQAINNGEAFQDDCIDKLIAMAYYIGKEEATKTICDKSQEVFASQVERAKECRYHKMAMQVQGDVKMISSYDYRQDMTKTFGDDETKF